MANPARGETILEIDGVPHTLCLTLGALAEIEALFESGVRLDARNLVTVLAVLVFPLISVNVTLIVRFPPAGVPELFS